jgi:hypothetical protein
MPTISENSFPFKIYDAHSVSTKGSPVYLGKSVVAGIDGSQKSFFPELAGNNCFRTFVISSLVSGKNVKLTPATEEDPYIYIDSRWYYFRPEDGVRNQSSTWHINNVLSNVDFDEERDIVVTMKSIYTDNTIRIIDQTCTIDLSTYIYRCSNLGLGLKVREETYGVPGQENSAFMFKSLKAGRCITMREDGHTIIIGIDLDNPECPPCPCEIDCCGIPTDGNGGKLKFCEDSACDCATNSDFQGLLTEGVVNQRVEQDLVEIYQTELMLLTLNEEVEDLEDYGSSFPGLII